MYDDHLRLIVKRVVDFLLVLVELFSLHVTAEALRAIIGSKSATLLQPGPLDPKFQVEGVVAHQPLFFSENYANDLLYDIKIRTDLSSVLPQCKRFHFDFHVPCISRFIYLLTYLLTDRRTDRQTDRILIAGPRLHSMQRNKN